MNRRAFVLGAAMVFACNVVAVVLRSFAETAFLAAYGPAKLPWLLIANAGGFAAATLGYDVITRRAHTRVVDVALLGALLVTAGAGPVLLDAGVPPVLLVVALAAVSQVAGLALWNRVAASVAGRDARRMLPRAGAAVTLGGAIAGLGAGALVYRLGITVLPYLGAAVTAIVLGLCLAQDRALADGGAPGATAPAGTPEGLGELPRRLLRMLVIVALLEGAVATVIDLQFVATLKQRYTGDTLAVAVSLFYGGTNALLFVLQSTAVPRILVTRSLPTTAAIHPVLAIGAYLVFLVAPGFTALAGTRTADQVLRLATSRTSQEIELSALPPGPRARWKVLLRGAMWPAGAALAALALLVIGPAAVGHARELAGAAIGLALVWAIAAQLGARRFQTALAAPLGIRARRTDDVAHIDLDTLERWSALAGADDATDAGLARAALARARVDVTTLADHLRHDDASVRAALLEQLGRAPAPALRGELRAAVEIEDDDRALALGVRALALAGDDGATPRARSRAALSREVADAVRSAERMHEPDAVLDELATLCERDPAWAAALVRAHRPSLVDDALAASLRALLARPSHRRGAFIVITREGPDALLADLDAALQAGDAAALDAVASLDEPSAAWLTARVSARRTTATAAATDTATNPIAASATSSVETAAERATKSVGSGAALPRVQHLSALARAAIARALAAAPSTTTLVGILLGDDDPEVAHAALRTALAISGGGTALPAGPVADANRVALAALVAHLDARETAHAWSACARHELELALRRCVARVLWAAAVEAASTGRDPAPLAAAARHLIGGAEPARRRALDVVQELQAGRAEILAVLERWLRPPATPGSSMPAPQRPDAEPTTSSRAIRSLPEIHQLATFDPWLARLAAGALATLEPTLIALRMPPLFATMPGAALAALATRAHRREVTGALFAEGDAGNSMFVIIDGTLTASLASGSARTIPTGGVVGELAVLTHAPRAATVTADRTATVLEIDRETFSATSRRAPELVLGLSATLAGWLAPERPDVL